jgi:tRNA(fMet)-specific endonuclease VapC
MPVTVLGELYCGLHKCNNPEKEHLRVSDMRARSLILGIDECTAICYAEVYASLEAKGTMIPLNDIWIAAFAIRHAMPLLARDDHFARIEGLELIAL